MPTRGPSRRIWVRPGRARSRREPSSTTRVVGPLQIWLAANPASRAASWRAVTWASSSLIRRATLSASVPISDSAACPSRARACGSQRTHSQLSRPLGSVSTHTCRSAGECSTAACATSQRPIDRGSSPRPAMPSTPCTGIGTVIGTSGSSRGAVRLCSSWAGSETSTSERCVPVPTRSSA